jgi:hypothetical protein
MSIQFIDFSESDDEKFNTCIHRSSKKEEIAVMASCCGKKKTVKAYKCNKRNIVPLESKICNSCLIYQRSWNLLNQPKNKLMTIAKQDIKDAKDADKVNINSNLLFRSYVTVRSLRIGDTFGEWDIWNTCRGLERIPRPKIGHRINYIQPRDIFLRPITMSHDMDLEEWERWNHRDRRLYD